MTKTAAPDLDEQIALLDKRIETLRALTNPNLRECPEDELHAAIDRKLTAETEIPKLLEARNELLRRKLDRQQETHRQQRLKEVQQTEVEIEAAHQELERLAAEFNELNLALAAKLQQIDELANKVRHLPNKIAIIQDETDPLTNDFGNQQPREVSPLIGETRPFSLYKMMRTQPGYPGLPIWIISKNHYLQLLK